MRSFLSILAALVVCGCATDPQAIKASLPLQIWRAEGEAPHMRPARLEIGSTANGAPFFLTVEFAGDDTRLGPVKSVSWQMSIDGEAITAGGRFTLAIEDDEGGRWLPAVIDTLTPAARNRLFALNRARFEATKPETVPVAGETPMIMVQRQAVALPQPPRACPG